MDTEPPVVWPSWCYSSVPTTHFESSTAGDSNVRSGSKPSAESPTTTSDAHETTPLVPTLVSSAKILTARRRRPAAERNSLSSNSNPTDYVIHNNNNNHVKNERLSPNVPGTSDGVTNRSRSVTPSPVAHSDTPPSNESNISPHVSLHMNNNYSNYMRSLAAKYQEKEFCFGANTRNGFTFPQLDPRFKPLVNFPNLLPTLPNIPHAIPPKEPEITPTAPTSSGKTDYSSSLFLNPVGLTDLACTQLLVHFVKQAKEAEKMSLNRAVKRQSSSSPLDLSAGAGPAPAKRPRLMKPTSSISPVGTTAKRSGSVSPNLPKPHNHPHEDISHWTVDDVCNFVSSIDICAEYAQNFRNERIDGSGLPLLTEEHLTTNMSMKLGPALKLRSILAKKLGSCNMCLHCTGCHSSASPEHSGISGTGNNSDSGGGTS